MPQLMLIDFDNIVFDLGGVVFDIDRDLCVHRLEEIGLPEAAALLDLYKQQGDFLDLEQGKITAARFFDILRNKCANGNPTDSQIEEALCSFITSLPVERLKAIRKLRSEGKYTFVLSNTNPIMYNSVIARLFRQEGLSINDYFDGIITSFTERVCKPEPEIFEILLRRYRLNPERTLFIDDSKVNIEAAERCGIKGLFLPKNRDFIEVLFPN